MTKLTLSLVIFFSLQAIGYAQSAQWESQADTLMSQQQFEKAIDLYSKVINASGLKEKDDYRTVYKRAFAYYYTGQFDLALKDIAIFIPQFSQVAQAHILRSLIYGQTGEEKQQLESLERAIELQVDNLELIKWRGSLQMQQGEYEKAKTDFLKVRNQLADAELETSLGMTYYSLEKVDSAFMCLNKSIELDATYQTAYLYAGSFCLELEQYTKGIQYLDLALLLNPENQSAWFYKGIALIELKRTDEGCRLLTKAFNAGQDDAVDYLKEYCYGVYK